MTGLATSPRVLKGGLVLLDPATGVPVQVITFQYNPDMLTRSLQVQGMGDAADRTEALRLKGPAVETIRVEAELDLTDALETGDAVALASGLHPQLAALEAMIQPTSRTLQTNDDLARIGTLEIVPAEAPLAVFVWGRGRVVPVRVTEFSVTEEAFDTALNPIRAKATLGLRVLTINDVGFGHRAGMLFMAHLRAREQQAGLARTGGLGAMGVEGLL
ncbi:hypothetical protein E2C06_13300 [Dankookia rubra]|uniref:Uncharacterized protein n=1 Tax=Dankookia rubra TaxID=1442381 RepID=A0A4R5QFU2_9PROT|nr:hypothetical protein [Dankookia rubra]TDH62144.1 hypothetical protein E2C06_13300 [Dankookia rubra]